MSTTQRKTRAPYKKKASTRNLEIVQKVGRVVKLPMPAPRTRTSESVHFEPISKLEPNGQAYVVECSNPDEQKVISARLRAIANGTKSLAKRSFAIRTINEPNMTGVAIWCIKQDKTAK